VTLRLRDLGLLVAVEGTGGMVVAADGYNALQPVGRQLGVRLGGPEMTDAPVWSMR
jgi:hypothetical protein